MGRTTRGRTFLAAALSTVACESNPGSGLKGPATLGVSLRHPENRSEVEYRREDGAELVLAGPDRSSFRFDGARLVFVAPPNFEAPSDVDGDGLFRLFVRGDGAEPDAALEVELVDVDEPPEWTGPTRFAIAEGSVDVGRLSASDPEGRPVRFGLVPLEDAGQLTLMGDALRFREATDFEQPADMDGDNRYRVRVRALDPSDLAAERVIEIAVTDVDEGPLLQLEALFPPRGARVGSPVSLAALFEATGFEDSPRFELNTTLQRPRAVGANLFAGRVAITATRALQTFRARIVDGTNTAAATLDFEAGAFFERPIAASARRDRSTVVVLDAVGPRVHFRTRDGAQRWAPRAGASDVRDLTHWPGEDFEALVLTSDGLRTVNRTGQSRVLQRVRWTEGRALHLPDERAGRAYVLAGRELLEVDLRAEQVRVLSGPGRGRGPSLASGVDVVVNPLDAVAFVQTPSAQGFEILRVALSSGDRRVHSRVPVSMEAAAGLVLDGSTALALARDTLFEIRQSDGALLRQTALVDPDATPILGGRLASGLGPHPILVRSTPAGLFRIDRVSVQAEPFVADDVAEGPRSGPIEALVAHEGGDRVDILGRRALVTLAVSNARRRAHPIDLRALSAPAQLWTSSDPEEDVLVGDRDADAIFAISSSGQARRIPGPEGETGQALDAPQAVAFDEATDRLWVVEAVPPSVFVRSEGRWTRLVSGPELGVPLGAWFDFSARGRAYLIDAARLRVVALDLASGALREVSSSSAGSGPALSNLTAITGSKDGLFVLDGLNRLLLLHVDPVDGRRTIVSGESRGSGPSLRGATSLAADGRGRIYVGLASGALLVVERSSGDRAFVSR